jgi:integrase
MAKIKPLNNNNSIQIKFSRRGNVYRFTPIPGAKFSSPEDIKAVEVICERISNDIRFDNFDGSIEKYCIIPKKVQNVNLPKKLIEIVELWVEALDKSEDTKAGHYKNLKIHIRKHDPGLLETDWLVNSDVGNYTFNLHLSMLKRCFDWGLRGSLTAVNPWNDVSSRKHKKRAVKPFKRAERELILEGFKELHPHYLDFVKFLFFVGCRLSEAIGMTWEKVDFENNELTISESLSIDRLGNGYRRKMKETKTGSETVLTMNQPLREMLAKRYEQRNSKFIFRTLMDKTISSSNFTKYWKEVLEYKKVPYRKIHTMRHTFGSEGIQQGIPITGVAYLLGHKDITMVSKTYAHLIERPNLPNI